MAMDKVPRSLAWFAVTFSQRVRFTDSTIGSISDTKDTLKSATEKNRRLVIQKMPVREVNKGLERTCHRQGTNSKIASIQRRDEKQIRCKMR
jgi:D-arabinose 1-dehydrogenase-like Zn-dependent alcohol dehydrogenase